MTTETKTLDSGHVVTVNTKTGTVRATCQFCEKTKTTKVMGACYNHLNGSGNPIWMCNACSKETGYDNGNVVN